MYTKPQLSRLRKSELVDLVLELQQSAELGSTEAAVRSLVESLGDLTPSRRLDAASAIKLAEAIDYGPELARAGLVKQLSAVHAALVEDLEGEEDDDVDRLAAAAAGPAGVRGADEAEDPAPAPGPQNDSAR